MLVYLSFFIVIFGCNVNVRKDDVGEKCDKEEFNYNSCCLGCFVIF